MFALLDMVGLDLMPHVNASMAASLPKSDAFHTMNKPLPLIEKMIADGYTGRKGKGGFYRVNRAEGKRKEAIDLKTGQYRKTEKPEIAALSATKKVQKLLSHASVHGQYAFAVMGATLSYAAELVGDAADSIDKIDEAMRLGYNWKQGPFELIDQIGADWVIAAFEKAGLPVAPILKAAAGRTFYRVENGQRQMLGLDGSYHDVKRPEGVLMLADIKLRQKPIIKNASAALWDVGDGVACFEFTSKMNSIDTETFALLAPALKIVEEKFRALVLYNEGSNFSAGANLGYAIFTINIAGWEQVSEMVAGGQKMMKAMRYAPFPVVGAPSAWRWEAVASFSCIAMPCRRTPKPTWVSSKWVSVSFPDGVGARRCSRAGRSPENCRVGRCRLSARRSRSSPRRPCRARRQKPKSTATSPKATVSP